MKVLAMALFSLYKPQLQSPLFFSSSKNSSHNNFIIFMFKSSIKADPQIFSHPKHKSFSSNSTIVAACVDNTSRTETNTSVIQFDDRVYDNYMKSCRPNSSDYVSCKPNSQNQKSINRNGNFDDEIWLKMQDEAKSDIESEPILSSYYYTSILVHNSLESALSNHLSIKLCDSTLSSKTLFDLIRNLLVDDREIMASVKEDLKAVRERDPACVSYVHCLLNFKGFLACQAHRLAHKLWSQNRKVLALLIQNRVSETFAVDIHPGAKIGRGILFDHATGIVIGETAVIGNNVSILHNVTLGGTGKITGDRHPKIGDGVLIGAGTCILGNVRIGDGAKIGAGSVVLKDVPAKTTAVGNPAKLIGGKENPMMLDKIPSFTMDQTSHISNWSDYVI